jgi:hypothetical protein
MSKTTAFVPKSVTIVRKDGTRIAVRHHWEPRQLDVFARIIYDDTIALEHGDEIEVIWGME